MLRSLRALSQPILTRLRRGGRRAHEAGSRAHLELRGVDAFDWSTEARRLEAELEALRGVRWARVNLSLGAVIVEREASQPPLEALVDAVARIEATLGARAHPFDARRPERHPGDAEPIERTPGVSTFFGCTPLGPLGWAQGAGAAVAATGAALIAPAVRQRVRRRREKRTPATP